MCFPSSASSRHRPTSGGWLPMSRGWSLGLLPLQSIRVMMSIIVEKERLYDNQQRDHRSALREFREG